MSILGGFKEKARDGDISICTTCHGSGRKAEGGVDGQRYYWCDICKGSGRMLAKVNFVAFEPSSEKDN